MAKKLNEGTTMGVDIDGDGKPDFSFDMKTLVMFVITISTVIGMWFTLQADIARAMEMPEPQIERIEYDLKDELVRQTIMDTQEDVEDILRKLEKLDERLYEISKNQ
jgi:hypothetical protein|tara:strand:+ start:1575 stop:1895 length:321 start_codon:yes stop_codon:yes gene_type:complete